MINIVDLMYKDENKENLIDFFDSIVRKNIVYKSQLLRLHERKYNEQEFKSLLNKINEKYDSDNYRNKWYSLGIEPPEPLLSFLYDYAMDYGKKVSDLELSNYSTPFTHGIYKIHNTLFRMDMGQGVTYQIIILN